MSQETLTLIEELGRVLTAGELPELAGQVAAIAHRNSQFERVRFYLAHPRSDTLVLEGSAGAPYEESDRQAELSSRSLLGRAALQNGGPVLTDLPAPDKRPTAGGAQVPALQTATTHGERRTPTTGGAQVPALQAATTHGERRTPTTGGAQVPALQTATGDDPAPDQAGDPQRRIPACIVPFRLPSAHVGVLMGDNPSGRAICEHDARVLKALADFAAAGMTRATTGSLGVHSVSLVSHELRTPLTAIYAFTEMLLDGDAGPLNPRQEQYVTQAHQGAALLRKIVEDLLELTRLEQGRTALELTDVDVRGFVLDTVNNFQPQAQAKQIALNAEAPAGLPRLCTDKTRLRQALGNLIDNAIKYSPAGSAVRVTVEASAGQVRIAVRDQGPGISPAQQHQVFNAFFRCFQDEGSLRQKGSGLGLTVVQCIARLLGAEVQLESAPGKGATFRLIFPAQPNPNDRPATCEAFSEPTIE